MDESELSLITIYSTSEVPDELLQVLEKVPDQSGFTYLVYIEGKDELACTTFIKINQATSMKVWEATPGLAVRPNHLYLLSASSSLTVADGVFVPADPEYAVGDEVSSDPTSSHPLPLIAIVPAAIEKSFSTVLEQVQQAGCQILLVETQEAYDWTMNGHMLCTPEEAASEVIRLSSYKYDELAVSIAETRATLSQEQLFIDKIVNTTPDIIYLLDLSKKNILYINQRAVDILGHSGVEHIYKQKSKIFREVLHPDDYPRRMEHINACKNLKKNEIREIDLRLKVADGTWRWFKVRDRAFLRAEDGTVLQTIGILQDIQERKETLDQLREEHLRFRNAESLGNIGSFERILPSPVLSCSDEFYRIHGLEPQSMVFDMEKLLSFVHPEDQKAMREQIWATHAHSVPLDLFQRIIRLDGSIRYVHRRAEVIKDEHGKPTKVYGTIQDFTELKHAQFEAEKNKSLMEAVFNGSLSEMMVLTAVRNERGEIFDFEYRLLNQVAQTMAGYNLVGKRYLEMNPQDRTSGLFDLYRRVVESGESADLERFYKGSGYCNWFRITAVKLDDGVVLTVEDITSRKQIEEENLQASKLLRDIIEGIQVQINYLKALYDEKGTLEDFLIVLTNEEDFLQQGNKHIRSTSRKFSEVLPGYRQHVLWDRMVEVYQTGSSKRFETLYDLDGLELWMDVSIVKHETGLIFSSQIINDRKRAEEALNQTLSVFRRAEEAGALGSYEADLATMTFHFSDNMFRLFGKDPNSFVPTLEFIDAHSHPDDVLIVSNILEEAVLTKQPYTYTRRIFLPDGQIRYMHAHGIVVCDQEDRPVKLLGIVQDITERKKAEEEVVRLQDEITKKVTDKYLTLFNSIDEGFYQCEVIFDENKEPVDILYLEENPAAVRIIGRSSVGKTLKEINPDYEEKWFRIWGDVALTGESKRMEQYSGPDNKWFNFFITRVGDESSRQVVVLFQDITAIKSTQQELQQSKDLLQSVFDISYNGFSVLKSVRDEQGELVDLEYIFANKATKQIHQRDDLEGNLYSQVHTGFLGTDYFEVVKRVVETGEPHQYQLYYDLDHFDNWFNITTVKLNDGVVVSLEDISTVKKAELSLRESEDKKTFLLQLSDALRQLSDPLEIQDKVCRMIAEYYQADRAYYAELDLDRQLIVLKVDYAGGDLQSLVGSHPLQLYAGVIEQMQAGYIPVVEDIESTPLVPDSERPAYSALSVRSFVCVPLIKKGELIACFTVVSSNPRTWTSLEIKLLQEVAERTWHAVLRAKTEEALQDVNARLVDILESTTDAFYALDADFNFTYVNSKAAQLWHRAPETLIGKHIWTAFPDAVDTDSYQKHYEVLKEGKPVHYQTVSPLIGVWVDVSIYPGKNGSLSVFFRDITERKQAEEALRESEQRFRSLVEPYALAVWETAPDGVPLKDNPSWRAFTGQTYEEFREYGWGAAIHPEDKEYVEQQWREAVATRRPMDIEYRFRQAQGGWRWTNVRATPILDKDGKIIKWTGMNIDIHDRKMTEYALKDSEVQFRLFVTSSSDLVYKMNADWSQMYSLTGKDFLTDTLVPINNWINKYIPEEEQPLLNTTIQAAIESKSMFELEHRVIKADGIVGWASSRAVPVLDEEGNITEWLGTVRDVTLRKSAELQLQAFNTVLEQQVAERASALKQSKERLEAAINVSPMVLSVLKSIRNDQNEIIDFYVDWVSRGGEKMVGKDVSGGRLLEEFPYLLKYGIVEEFVKTVETGTSTDFEYLYDEGGYSIWVRWKAVKLGDGLFAAVEDITRRKKAELQIEAQEHFIRGVTETMPDMISVMEYPSRTIKYINQEPYILQGFDAEDMLSMSNEELEQLMHPEDIPATNGYFDSFATLSNDEVASYEYRAKTKSGEWQWFRVRGRVFERDDEGRVKAIVNVVQNINEQKKATEEMEKAHEQIQSMFETIPLHLTYNKVIRDEQGKVVDFTMEIINQANLERSGLTLVDIGKPLTQIRSGIEGLPFWESMLRVAETGEPITDETFYDAHGYEGWILASIVPFMDGVLVAALNINDRKKAESDLQKQLTILKQAEEVARMGSWEYEVDHDKMTWSDGMYRLFGLEPQTPVSLDLYNQYAADEDRERIETFSQKLRKGEAVSDETICIQIGKDQKYLKLRSNALTQDNGQVLSILGIELDVTESVEAEIQLRQLTENLQIVLESSPAYIGYFKPLRDVHGQIVDYQLAVCNKRFAGYMQTSVEQLIGTSQRDLDMYLWPTHTFDVLHKVHTTGDHVYEERHSVRDGEDHWLGISVLRQEDGVVVTGLNVTKLRHAAQQEKHWMQELERSNETLTTLEQMRQYIQMRGEFLRTTSHDLRGSFGVIVGATSLLDMMNTEEERAQTLHMLRRSLKQVNHMMNQLLDFSRLESGQEELHVAPFDAAELLIELSESVMPLAQDKDLWIKAEGPKQLRVEGDNVKLSRIVQNLMLNAIKYTSRGGVKISWGLENEESPYWLMTVGDTGPGISQQLIDQLTDKQPAAVPNEKKTTSIEQEDNLTTYGSRTSGEGIGLIIVKRLCELMNAELEIESTPRVGTVFRIRFPIRYSE